jgi:hypothetical protein
LTNAFSKKWEKHHAALALYFGYYNFCRMHKTLRCTPAMAAGITKTVLTLKALLLAYETQLRLPSSWDPQACLDAEGLTFGCSAPIKIQIR